MISFRKYHILYLLTLCVICLLTFPSSAQRFWDNIPFYTPDPAQRVYDSLIASRIPIFPFTANAPSKTMPDSLDNSPYMWFPGILDQLSYFACQQFCGAAYTFAYEVNRLRDVDGHLPENRYPAHYTWHFFNDGEKRIGVNFLHSFHAMMEQGHMTITDFGPDSAQLSTGWIDGYEKYYRAMRNRIHNVYAIPVNSAEGIQTVKQYLFDHLDGSSTGGVACFTASSPSMSGGSSELPEGTPEAGKYVMLHWQPYPTHGMTIVGYHDSIRYDLNNDGQFTNDIDINQDSIVDARDWEIGGFRLANSYGKWWADQGFFYVLYSAMASEFEEGGVWNNCVYIVEPDPDYSPVLTVKVSLEHVKRDQLNIMTGISQDPDAEFPDYVLDPPIFSNQGGAYYMQGFDSIPSQKNLEFGLDVTPLLSFVEPDVPVKFFLIIEERDENNIGQGRLHEASFLHYGTTMNSFSCEGTDILLQHNGTTIVSATGTVTFEPPKILNDELPPISPSEDYSVQFQAQHGEAPYSWSISQPYYRMADDAQYEPFTDVQLFPQSDDKPFAMAVLPFSFPFYGSHYDTVYVNAYGMVQLTPDHLIYPYLCSVTDMLAYSAAIIPSLSQDYTIRQQDGDGMWMNVSPDSVMFRWKLSLLGIEQQSNIEFSVILYPDGKASTCFGSVETGPNALIAWTGVAKGEKYNTHIRPILNMNQESGKSYLYVPPILPDSISMTPEGLLTINGADSSKIYDLIVRVTDMQSISREKHFQLSNGLLIRHQFVSTSGFFQYQEPVTLDLTLTNTGSEPLSNLELTFHCAEASIQISDSLEIVPALAAGETIQLIDAFAFILEENLTDQTPIAFRIIASTQDRDWETRFFLEASAPDIKIMTPVIEDGTNGLLDIGETADLMISVSNLGTLPAEELSLTLYTQDSLVEILSSPTLYLASLGQKVTWDAYYRLRASRSVTAGHTMNLQLHISNGSSIDIIYPFSIPIGINPIALIKLTDITTSINLMVNYLDSLQVSYDLHTSMPPNLNMYPCAFLVLGTSYSGSYALSTEETLQLISYLNNGGTVYMESYASWYYGNSAMLEEVFHFSTDRVSVYNFNELDGVSGTLTDGMEYPYLSSSAYAIFEVTPKGDGFPLMNNLDVPPKCIEFGYDGDDYKTIGTFKEFGLLVDGQPPSQKAILFTKYMEFMEVNIEGPYPFFHADTTHICKWHMVRFMDDSFENVTSWQWEFPGGTPAWSDEQNPVVKYHHSGVYDVILTISDGIHSQTMHKKEYIHVTVCMGVDEAPSSAEQIRIYPNPAKGIVWIEFAETLGSKTTIDLFNLQGMLIRHYPITGNTKALRISLDISGISEGMYIIRAISGQGASSRKLIVTE